MTNPSSLGGSQEPPLFSKMIALNPIERARTYIFKSGHRQTYEGVTHVGIEQGWDRLRTQDGKLHIVLLIVKKGDQVIDYCIAKELDTDDWTF
jgi:hypothetical protein